VISYGNLIIHIIGRLFRYFSVYFVTFAVPAAESLFFLVLAILAMESADSIRSLYRHFLSGITTKPLNAFYYACSYAKVDCSVFMNVTAKLALRLIPADLGAQPPFLCIDDTMASKPGKKFEDVSKLSGHAAHNGSNYLNGHCFVSLMLRVPVWHQRRVSYLAVPPGYRMWQKKESKLEPAAAMVRHVMPEFYRQKNVIILCGSWYVKQNLVSIVDEYDNPDLIGNARADSVLYDLPSAPTGKKGRPAQLQIFFAWQEKAPLNRAGSGWMQYIPLLLCSFRWDIEVSYYEQKSFWSLCAYMVRSRRGIETLPVVYENGTIVPGTLFSV